VTDYRPASPLNEDVLQPLTRTARREHSGEALSLAYFRSLRATQQTGTFTWDRQELGLRECKEVAGAATTIICRKTEDEDLEALARVATTQSLRAGTASLSKGKCVRGKRALEKIVLLNGQISQAACPALGRLMQGCSSLRSLSLVGCALGNKGALVLSEAWLAGASGAVLSELCLDGCQIGTPGAAAIALAVKESPSLKKLVLSHNRLSREYAPCIREMLLTNRSLMHLDLSYSELSDEVLLSLGEALDLQNLSQSALTHLRVNGNKAITDKGVVGFAEALEHNVVLTHLYMSDCSITDVGCIAFADCILFNKQIKSIWLCNNLIVQSGVEAMERAIISRNAMNSEFSPTSSSLATADDFFSLTSGRPSATSSIGSSFSQYNPAATLNDTRGEMPQSFRTKSQQWILDRKAMGRKSERQSALEDDVQIPKGVLHFDSEILKRRKKTPIEVLLDGNPIATSVIQRYAQVTGVQIFEDQGLLAAPNMLPQTIIDDPRSEMSRPFTAPAFNSDLQMNRSRGGYYNQDIKYSQSTKQLPHALTQTPC